MSWDVVSPIMSDAHELILRETLFNQSYSGPESLNFSDHNTQWEDQVTKVPKATVSLVFTGSGVAIYGPRGPKTSPYSVVSPTPAMVTWVYYHGSTLPDS